MSQEKIKNEVTVLIAGRNHTGKTTIQRIIADALRAHGIECTLGETAQHENNLLGSYAYDENIATGRVAETTRVVIDERHAHEKLRLPAES